LETTATRVLKEEEATVEDREGVLSTC
jgi:hypothetical protein